MDGRHGSGHVKTSQLALLHPSVLWQKLRIPLSGRGAVDGAGATESHVKRTQLLAIMQPKHKNETYCSRSYQKKICCFFCGVFSFILSKLDMFSDFYHAFQEARPGCQPSVSSSAGNQLAVAGSTMKSWEKKL